MTYIEHGFTLAAFALGISLGGCATNAQHTAAPKLAPVSIQLPNETAAFKPSDLPGYALAQQNCLTCHSADYPSTQPPSTPRAAWVATVKKMIKPYAAPIDEANVEPIADYLVKTYGAEQPK